MGVYDSYGKLGTQLKVGPRCLIQYEIGDEVEIPDGVYVGYSGAVVIIDGRFAAEFEAITSKWGDELGVEAILRSHDEVAQTLDKWEEQEAEGLL